MKTGAEIVKLDLWNVLPGSYCHKLDDDGNIERQGYVVELNEQRPVIQWFSFMTGEENGQASVVSLLEFDLYRFYDNRDEFLTAYQIQEAKWNEKRSAQR